MKFTTCPPRKVDFRANTQLWTTAERAGWSGPLRPWVTLSLMFTLRPDFPKPSTDVKAVACFCHLGKKLLLHNFLQIASLGKRTSEEQQRSYLNIYSLWRNHLNSTAVL